MPRAAPRKYDPLVAYLVSLTADQVQLTLPEIEAIIGAPLPVSAWRSSFWTSRAPWAGAARSWMQAGWRVTGTELHAWPPAVTFGRVASRAVE